MLAMPQATSFDSILEQCRDLVCERVADALSKMLEQADEALTVLGNESREPDAKKLYQVTRNKVLSQREAIVTQFRMRFLREFQERGNRVKKIGDRFAEIDLSSLELELVAEDDLDESLKFNAMASKLRQYCEEELVALDQRVGVLIGDANLQAEDNPFTPQAICDAYKQTCRQVDSNVDVRKVLLKLFDDHVLDEIRAVYKAVNGLLIENSILPKIRFSVARGKEGAKPPTTEPRSSEQTAQGVAQAANKAPGSEQDLFAQLQKLLGGNLQAMVQPGGVAAAGTSAGSSAALQNAELLSSLTRIQLGDASGLPGGMLPPTFVAGAPGTTNILQELKSTSLGSGMNQMDAMTLDIMALLFDELFDDPKIPNSVKGLIGRLQIPMLKVAIADKSFFSKKAHPARQMLDKLGEISAGLPGDFSESDPIYRKLESILQDLINGFEDEIKIFNDLRERLEILLAEVNERAEERTQSIATQIEQEERLALAKTIAQAEIKIRVRASAAPRPIIEFLAHQWVKLLIVIQVKEGEKSETWKDALDTVDLLLWSSEPKVTIEERRNMVERIPELLKRLAAGLGVAGIDDDVRVRFFSDLRKLHSEIIDTSAKSKSKAGIDEPAIEDGLEETKTDVGSEQPEAVETTEARNIVLEPEESMPDADPGNRDVAATSLDSGIVVKPEEPETTAQPDAAETSDKAVERDVVAREQSDDTDTTQERGIAVSADEGETAEIPEPADTAAPLLATTAAPSPASDSLQPDLDFEGAPEDAVKPEAPPADALSTADSSPPSLDFEAAPEELTKAEAVPADASPTADSLFRDLDFEAAPEELIKPEAVPADASPTADSSFPDLDFESVSKEPVKPDDAPLAKPAAQQPRPEPTKPAHPVALSPAKPGVTQPTPTSSKTTGPVPLSATKPAAEHRAPASTRTAQPIAAAAAKQATSQPTPTPSRTAQPVPTAPAKPPTAQPGRTATNTAQPVAASALRSHAPGEGSAANSTGVDLSAPIVVKNPFGEGEVQVDDLDFTDFLSDKSAKREADGKQNANRKTDYAAIPGNLAVGSWVEVREKRGSDKSARAKLSIVSPLKTRFVFVTRQGLTVLDCSRAELARRFQLGEVTMSIEEKDASLFDRIAGGLVGKLGGAK